MALEKLDGKLTPHHIEIDAVSATMYIRLHKKFVLCRMMEGYTSISFRLREYEERMPIVRTFLPSMNGLDPTDFPVTTRHT